MGAALKLVPSMDRVEGQKPGVDTACAVDHAPETRFKVGEVIKESDITRVIESDFRKKEGTDWVELLDGLEAEVELVEEGRFRITETMNILRSVN